MRGRDGPLHALGEQRVEPLAHRLQLAAQDLHLLRRGIEHLAARRAIGHEARLGRLPPSTIVARAGMPTITAPSGTSCVTTALAPIRARLPTVIGPSTCAPEPMITPSAIVGWRLPATPLSGLVPPSVTH